MKNVTLSLLVPLLASGCGSSPTSPASPTSPTLAAAPEVRALSFQFAPDAEAGKGWRSPIAITLRSVTFAPPAVVEKAVFRMIDDHGDTLAESSIAAGGPMPPDGYMDARGIVQTMTWPAERGYAKRLDIALTVRGASGELSTVTASISAK